MTMSIKEIEQKYLPYLDKWVVYEHPNYISVALIVVNPKFRGRGIGREIFKAINEYADKVQKIVTLTPSSEWGYNKNKLTNFYKSLGFVLNKGRYKNYDFMELMYRPPRNLKESLETINTIPQPSYNDISDAIDHAAMSFEEVDEDSSIDDFDLKYLGKLTVDELGYYDDLSSWMEDIEDDNELEAFRGKHWAQMTKEWGDNPPPVIVVTGETFSTIGDGRGRVTYANYKGIPLHVWELRYKDAKPIEEGVFSNRRFKRLAGLFNEGKKTWDEVQSELFRGSGVNATTDFEEKIPKFSAYMKKNGWGRMPPIRGGIHIVDEQDLEQYKEAEEGGYEHELDWSRPLSDDDLGMEYAYVTDGHNRAWAAHQTGIPIRVKRN